MRILASVFTLFFLILPAKADINKIKTFLNQRENVARIYIPEMVTVGDSIDLLVLAPGAESVILQGSAYSGAQGAVLNYSELATEKPDSAGRVKYRLSWPEEEMQDMAGKDYYIEALLKYPGETDTKKALVFGSNANYIGHNAIRIMPKKKDYSGVANMAKSFIPGLGANSQQSNF